ncbi:MAG TPA: penicillin-insensitive murein endopeptidase [Gaiellaceae bacterium]|nr:penicillin-insensitive murein endopeptidase [Gaiellaceae bacterium]
MSWRPGEVWLDADLLWFRERAAVPALAGFPAAVPRVAPAPGLVASRLRRAQWKRRRMLRRVGATAVVLSPAVMLPVIALRAGGGAGGQAAAEDPPSFAFRLDTDSVGAARGWLSTPLTLPLSVPAHLGGVRPEEMPTIEWHRATSVGLPYDGRLIDGTQLPVEGPNWVTWDPVTDSVPNAPIRLYGNEHTIRAIISVVDAYRAANPTAPRVVVGDISLRGGGPMTDEHVSHQNGLDVDVYYPRRDGELRAPVAADQIDLALAQDLVDRFVAAGAQMIFVGFGTGLHGPSGIVIPYPNHEYHMHVRFPAPVS